MLRILTYRALSERLGHGQPEPAFPAGANLIRVPTLNAPLAIDAVRAGAGHDLVCLMGARFLTRRTLRGLAAPVVNIHSSDPRRIRAGPVVVWEVLVDEPELTPVVHEATDVLDAGAILAEAAQPILYRGGLGATTTATMTAARPHVADLFANLVRGLATGTASRTPFAPGPLKVTPSVRETLRADLLCRRRSRVATADTPPASARSSAPG